MRRAFGRVTAINRSSLKKLIMDEKMSERTGRGWPLKKMKYETKLPSMSEFSHYTVCILDFLLTAHFISISRAIPNYSSSVLFSSSIVQ